MKESAHLEVQHRHGNLVCKYFPAFRSQRLTISWCVNVYQKIRQKNAPVSEMS